MGNMKKPKPNLKYASPQCVDKQTEIVYLTQEWETN